ncbi:MAG: hypothetical protein S0880_06700 [Actinomycetota bacterium]|nr:hypothetical protein [Actinomycetota bacterium]
MRPRTAAVAAVVLFGAAALLAAVGAPDSIRSAEAVPRSDAPVYARTGFWYPGDSADVARAWSGGAACIDVDDQASSGEAVQHLGIDLHTTGEVVRALDDGELIGVAEEDGTGVVFARHRTEDGAPFVAVYGRVSVEPALAERLALGEVPVAGGEPLPGVAVTSGGTAAATTIHLGVVAGDRPPPGPWLERPCGEPPTHASDDYVDPVAFLHGNFAAGAVAGPVDLRADCLARGGEAAVALDAASAGSWVCAGRRVADIDPADVGAACRLQLGPAATAVRVDDGPQGWMCAPGGSIDGAGAGGGAMPADLDGWCDATGVGGLEATVFNAAPFDADSWRCVHGVELGGFDFTRLCREAYDPNGTGRPPDTAATAADFADPASWRCYWTTRVP